MSRTSFIGKTVAVTGAGSGIGRALAIELSSRGASVACSDVDEIGLRETAASCPGQVETWLLDVSDRDAVLAHAEAVTDRFGEVHQIYNNAGIGFSGPVAESLWSDYERILRVDLNGVIHGTQAFLPHLIASGDGHVINISSINGIVAQPAASHYCTAKFGVRGFTEALRAEMMIDRLPVKVSVVHPGGVATNIAANSVALTREAGREVTAAHEARTRTYADKLLTMDPAKAARIIVRGVERGRPRILVGRDAIALDLVMRAVPSHAARLTVAIERQLRKLE